MKLKRKDSVIATILSLALGPFGYLYFGLSYFFAGILIAIIFSIVISLLRLPFTDIFYYLQFLIYGYFGYNLATITNNLAEGNLSDEDVREYKSFGLALYFMIPLLTTLAQAYALVTGLYFAYEAFKNREIFWGLILLIFGIGILEYIVSIAFGFVSLVLIKIFRIDKKYGFE